MYPAVLTEGHPQWDSTSPLDKVTLPIPTSPPNEVEAPAQAELGKTEVEITDARAAVATANADSTDKRSMLMCARRTDLRRVEMSV